MYSFNFVLSQFYFLSLIGGNILWALLTNLLEKIGLQGGIANGVAGAISILLIAIFVFGRWAQQKKNSSHLEPKPNSQYKTGSALVTFGNTIFLVLIAFLFLVSLKHDYVVGGVAVFFGGGISLISWLIGWHLAGYFRIY